MERNYTLQERRTRMRNFLWLVVLGCSCWLPHRAGGQTAGATKMAMGYDAVVIKPNRSGGGGMSWRTKDDSFVATNTNLKNLLVNAYGIRDGLISGMPAWAEGARFDINAKIIDPDVEALKKLTPEERRGMIAAILTERFGLKVHTEIKQLPVYELMIVKDGPRFKDSAAVAADPKGDPALRKGMGPGSMMTNNGELTSVAIPLSSLVVMLANELNRTVIDGTGLTGKYDLHLKWTPDRAAAAGTDNGQQPEDVAPPLFTALQEQLGLKLVASKGPVETLVVDRLNQPTEN